MNLSATQAEIDAATVYQDLFVPAEFEEWAGRMVDAAQLTRGESVLDVACGTGVLTRAAAERVGAEGRVAGIDPDAGMLTVAARLSPALEFRQGVAESLPYPEDSFDAVISQFGLMFFRDRTRALREVRRVLRPGGRATVAVWDTLENTPAYAAVVALLDRVAGSRAADALRAPFALGDRNELARVFASADLADITVTTHTGVSRFPSIRRMVEADLRGWLPVMGVVVPEEQIERIVGDAEHVLAPWRTADGRVHFESPAHVIVVRKQ